MPPRKKPKTLQDISLATIANFTDKLCSYIDRHYEDGKSLASQKELTSAKMYLSTIQPFFDILCKDILNLCSGRSLHLVIELLMCDKIRTLNLSKHGWSLNCLTDSVFWKNQLLKLNNVLELNIMGVRLMDESFQVIGDVCTNLRKMCITSDLRYASMESLLHVLKCSELQVVTIIFFKWKEKNRHEYTEMFLTGLPKLEHFQPFEYCKEWNEEGDMSIATPLTSMHKVELRVSSCMEVKNLIRLCPNLKNITLIPSFKNVNGRRDLEERTKVLKILAESSLQLDTLRLFGFTFSQEMTRLITSGNCTNLKCLDLDAWEGRRISVNDIYTVGVNCPKIEKLRISECGWDQHARLLYIQVHSPSMEEPTFVATPPMFVHLKKLFYHSNVDCDQRILPLILRHANRVKVISLSDVFKPTRNSIDMLSILLNTNTLSELESLSLEGERYAEETYMIPLSIASIERLLSCCSRLTELDIKCPMEYETVQYFRELQNDMLRQNFNLTLNFEAFLFINDYD